MLRHLPIVLGHQRGLFVLQQLRNAQHPDRNGVECPSVVNRSGNLSFLVQHKRDKAKPIAVATVLAATAACPQVSPQASPSDIYHDPRR